MILRSIVRPAVGCLQKLHLHGARHGERNVFKANKNILRTPFRNSGSVRLGYRCGPPDDPLVEAALDLMGGFLWFWILYHFYHHHEHLYTTYEYEDAEKWTDEELGIVDE